MAEKAGKSQLDFLKGLARSLTADLVGGPVDLAEAALNLGLAGGGYLGHKLGLLSPDQLPTPLSGSPGTSDWWAKGTPLADPGTGAYSAGRIGGAFLPAALPHLPKGSPNRIPLPESQRGALTLKGDPQLMLAHGTSGPGSLIAKNSPPAEKRVIPELYMPSFAVTRDELYTGFGDTFVIPKIGVFDPKVANTVLKNRDFYTPRYSDALGSRGDTLLRGIAQQKTYSTPAETADTLIAAVRRRLQDQFGQNWPHQGVWQEGNSAKTPLDFSQSKLPFHHATPAQLREPNRVGPLRSEAGSIHQQMLHASPRFQSFKHFEDSPYGARVLVPPYSNTSPVTEAEKWEATARRFLNARDPEASVLSPELLPQLIEMAKKGDGDAARLISDFKTLPSHYAEMKGYGKLPFNKDTIAGVVVPRGEPNHSAMEAIRRAGVPVETARDSRESFEVAKTLQHRASRNFIGPPKRLTEQSPKPAASSNVALPFFQKGQISLDFALEQLKKGSTPENLKFYQETIPQHPEFWKHETATMDWLNSHNVGKPFDAAVDWLYGPPEMVAKNAAKYKELTGITLPDIKKN